MTSSCGVISTLGLSLQLKVALVGSEANRVFQASSTSLIKTLLFSLKEQIELMKLRLGRALATARNARGWSQPHVAQLMGVDSETISRIERGHVVRLDRLYDLAVLYDIPIAALFHDAPGPRPDRIDEIVLALGLLDETNRQWVLDMVRAVTAKLER